MHTKIISANSFKPFYSCKLTNCHAMLTIREIHKILWYANNTTQWTLWAIGNRKDVWMTRKKCIIFFFPPNFLFKKIHIKQTNTLRKHLYKNLKKKLKIPKFYYIINFLFCEFNFNKFFMQNSELGIISALLWYLLLFMVVVVEPGVNRTSESNECITTYKYQK